MIRMIDTLRPDWSPHVQTPCAERMRLWAVEVSLKGLRQLDQSTFPARKCWNKALEGTGRPVDRAARRGTVQHTMCTPLRTARAARPNLRACSPRHNGHSG